MSPSDFRDTRPFGLMVIWVRPQWPMPILSQASGGSWRALEEMNTSGSHPLLSVCVYCSPTHEVANDICMANYYLSAVFFLVREGTMEERSESCLYPCSFLKYLLQRTKQILDS